MDFWEGLFLGPCWTHSDYGDRRHAGFFFGLGLLAILLLLAAYMLPAVSRFLPLPAFLYAAVSLLLVFTLPFAAAHYHRLPLLLRLAILALYVLQYGTAWLFVLKLFAGLASTPTLQMVFNIGENGNLLMTQLAQLFSFLGSLAATFAGVIIGALVISLVVLCVFLLLVYLPLLYFWLIRQTQRMVDRMVLRSFYKERLEA